MPFMITILDNVDESEYEMSASTLASFIDLLYLCLSHHNLPRIE